MTTLLGTTTRGDLVSITCGYLDCPPRVIASAQRRLVFYWRKKGSGPAAIGSGPELFFGSAVRECRRCPRRRRAAARGSGDLNGNVLVNGNGPGGVERSERNSVHGKTWGIDDYRRVIESGGVFYSSNTNGCLGRRTLASYHSHDPLPLEQHSDLMLLRY